jgi:NADPH:quinone reductase-like Zn-dependent oxidoreductase
MGYVIQAAVRSLYARQQGKLFMARPNRGDLEVLKDLIEAGKVSPVIDRTYPLAETSRALKYVGEGHARGKVVILV